MNYFNKCHSYRKYFYSIKADQIPDFEVHGFLRLWCLVILFQQYTDTPMSSDGSPTLFLILQGSAHKETELSFVGKKTSNYLKMTITFKMNTL